MPRSALPNHDLALPSCGSRPTVVKLQTVSLSVVLVRLRILVGPGKEVLFLGQEDLPIALEGDDLQELFKSPEIGLPGAAPAG